MLSLMSHVRHCILMGLLELEVLRASVQRLCEMGNLTMGRVSHEVHELVLVWLHYSVVTVFTALCKKDDSRLKKQSERESPEGAKCRRLRVTHRAHNPDFVRTRSRVCSLLPSTSSSVFPATQYAWPCRPRPRRRIPSITNTLS